MVNTKYNIQMIYYRMYNWIKNNFINQYNHNIFNKNLNKEKLRNTLSFEEEVRVDSLTFRGQRGFGTDDKVSAL